MRASLISLFTTLCLLGCTSQEPSPKQTTSPADSATPVRTAKVPKLTPGPKAQRPVDDVRWAVPLDPTSPTRGNGDTPLVTIILFEDLASPFSRHLHPTLNSLMDSSPGDIRLSYRHLPLPHNAEAIPSANAAHCAHEQGRFWEMRDALFRDERPDLARLPSEVGLDLPTFHACLAGPTPARRIAADAQAARRATVGGTPVLFVNGRKSAGALSLKELKVLVDTERTAAKARIAAQKSPHPTKALYDVIAKTGRARSPLSPVPSPIAERPLTRLGDDDGLISIRAWLDLSQESHRQSLKALINTTRKNATISLELFVARPGNGEDAKAWGQRLWCAKGQGKLWPLLEAAAAATRHTHGHPSKHVSADDEDHHDPDALDEVSQLAGLNVEQCENTSPKAATFDGPTWLINGRRYDGSLGWGPQALRRLITMVSPTP